MTYITPEDAVCRLLEYAGADLSDPELKDTPRRVLAVLDELRDAAEQVVEATTFDAANRDLIVVRGIQFYSLCAHHMLPFFGTASVGYLPQHKLLGLSKVPRVARKLASVLTTQERFTHALAEAISEMAETPDVAVVTNALHTCAVMRGPRAGGTELVASAMLGAFREDAALRAEFMSVKGD